MKEWNMEKYNMRNVHHEKIGIQEKKVQCGKSVIGKKWNMERVNIGNMYKNSGLLYRNRQQSIYWINRVRY